MLRITNPATGKFLGEAREDSPADVERKFQVAKKFQKSWAQTPLEKRLFMLQVFRNILEKEKERLSLLLTDEVGKPIRQSRNEIQGTLGRIDFFKDATPKALQRETVHSGDGIDEEIEPEPIGVVANISAWNYPYFVGSNVFLPALLTGNCVLYKPSEFATLTGNAIAEAIHRAGFPPEAFQIVVGGRETGEALLRQPVDGVFFTGSVATGKLVAENAPSQARLQLELGGKDPVYICEDVDIKNAASNTADGAFYNTGQSCCSVERIYVHKTISKEFIDHFLNEVRSFSVGDPRAETTYIGPLTRSSQLKVLEAQVAQAVSKGAKLLCGGKRIIGEGNFFEPTVLTHVDSSMAVMSEESFGPIIGIEEVSGDTEAISKMNHNAYGLTASVYTRDGERARRILSQLEAGSLYWNCCDRVSPRLPWSGRKSSGVGCTLSRHGIDSFLQYRAWHLKKA